MTQDKFQDLGCKWPPVNPWLESGSGSFSLSPVWALAGGGGCRHFFILCIFPADTKAVTPALLQALGHVPGSYPEVPVLIPSSSRALRTMAVRCRLAFWSAPSLPSRGCAGNVLSCVDDKPRVMRDMTCINGTSVRGLQLGPCCWHCVQGRAVVNVGKNITFQECSDYGLKSSRVRSWSSQRFLSLVCGT